MDNNERSRGTFAPDLSCNALAFAIFSSLCRAANFAPQVLADAGILSDAFFYDKDAVLIESLVDEEVRRHPRS